MMLFQQQQRQPTYSYGGQHYGTYGRPARRGFPGIPGAFPGSSTNPFQDQPAPGSPINQVDPFANLFTMGWDSGGGGF